MARRRAKPARSIWRARRSRRGLHRAWLPFGLFLPLIGFETVTNISDELILTTRWPLLFALRRHHRRRPLRLFVRARALACAARGSGRRKPRRRHGCVAISASGSCPSPSASSSSIRCIVILTAGFERRAEMDRQFRHPDPDLHDARLGPQHRGRARRPARSRLRRLLRGRRLFLCAAGEDFRPVVLDPAAARRHPVLVLGHPARLSGAAAARRLSRHRHARLRRDHPPHPDQLDRADQRLCRHHRHSAADLFRHSVQRRRQRLCRRVRARILAALSRHLSLLRHPGARRCSPASSPCGCAGCRSAAPGRRLREDEIACRSLGINTTNTKLTAFAMGAMFAGFAGSFFAAREAFISPESFTFLEFGDRPRRSSCSAAWAARSASPSPPSS